MPASSTIGDSLARLCVEHLEREDQALAQLNQSLREVQDALKAHETVRLPELLEAQQAGMSQVAAVRADRSELRRRIARAMQVAERDASITRWATTLEEDDRNTVMTLRERVARRADETSRLAQGSIAVVTHGMQVLSEVLHTLTGTATSSGRYEANGAPGPWSNAPLHQSQI